VLADAGYNVGTTPAGANVPRDIRNRRSIELLVLDGSEMPWIDAEIIDAIRAVDWALPIVVIARPDPELLAEARRQGVEAFLEAPVDAEDIRRAAASIVPVVPEAEFDLAG
jgi:DNA-binding NtrC family response regulator